MAYLSNNFKTNFYLYYILLKIVAKGFSIDDRAIVGGSSAIYQNMMTLSKNT
ncbi:hypothetical protein PKHYL_12520 [Psychrobacter sp. KH172YL61]|nr:hypothetical protein PKHYL_12520 [Psychrobacter sp. KH172YL61]